MSRLGPKVIDDETSFMKDILKELGCLMIVIGPMIAIAILTIIL